MNIKDPTAEELANVGELKNTEQRMGEEFDRARELETKSIEKFERSLWLANSGAATVTIGYITAAEAPTVFQFLGCCAFVVGVTCLLVMNFIGETTAVRDRARRQQASLQFFTEGKPFSIFGRIRDPKFKALAWTYKVLKTFAGVLFLAGCGMTLVGIYPNVRTSNAEPKSAVSTVVQEASPNQAMERTR